ncbi:MAG: hypothetical protein QOD06_2890 [Candidatus Binatota bacterium]|nr:hypothetical protein [Candidatus Binatota bacterium]
MRMRHRSFMVVVFTMLGAGCSWPPSPSLPAPNPQQAADDVQSEGAALTSPPPVGVPRVSPPPISVPRMGGMTGGGLRGGGLLR